MGTKTICLPSIKRRSSFIVQKAGTRGICVKGCVISLAIFAFKEKIFATIVFNSCLLE
ncbi:MAG: hypothetical protein AABZ92_00545 [Verrucomicrobiota bacterium]